MSKHSLTETRVSEEDGLSLSLLFGSTVKSTQSPGIFLNSLPYPFSFSPGLLSWSSFYRWGMICFFNCSLQMKIRASLVAQTVKNLPAMQETEIWVWSLGQKRSPGEGNGNPLQYSCLENSMDRGALWAMSMGLQRVRHDWATNT